MSTHDEAPAGPGERPLVVIGHSHTEAVAAAARARGVALDVLNFWAMPDPFVTEEGRLGLAPVYRRRLVAPVFSLIGGAVHQDIGLVVHPRPYDFVWPERPDLPLTPGADVIPYDALHAVMLERTQQFRDIISAVRKAAGGPVFHLESPPTFEHEELPQDDPGFYHFFGADAAFSPAWLRYKLWRVHSAIIAAHCEACGVVFVPHPPEAVDARGFLLPGYNGMPAHANAAYGALLLRQIQDAAAGCMIGVRVDATRGAPAPVAATAPDETVQGWVDGCEHGIVRGWAWRPQDPADRLILDVFVDGSFAAEGAAILPRGDLAEAGKGDGRYGFAIPVRGAEGGAVEVRVRGGQPLPGGALLLPQAGAQHQATALDVLWPPTPWRLGGGVAGFIDTFGQDGIQGWAQACDHPSDPVVLAIWEDDTKIAEIVARIWRSDLEAARQGDGRWGLAAEMPAALRDGRLHRLRVRRDDGSAAIDHPVIVRTPAMPAVAPLPAQADPPDESQAVPGMVRPTLRGSEDGVAFSIVVNFYNMRREAARTLTSLSRAYQRDIGDLRYEVLCIDNFSDPPLEAEWVASFGPEFRLVRPQRRLASPCAAINAAAALAQGRHLAIMIDGAHLLTPGVFREVRDAVSEAPEAIIALRQWFVAGDQRWLAEAGYTRAHEDLIFDKIGWPEDGYRLFREGTPFWESPRPWLDAMIESNCLFLPAALYRDLGGMDEAFSEAGAGFANLDLFRRAAEASPEPPVALIGEATFHQFHDGTTTNVTVAEKEQRVRRYESHYMALRGGAYPVTHALDIRLRGQIRSMASMASWQRPPMPSHIGVTDRVRPGSLALQFDLPAQEYLQSVYVENRLHEQTRWRGQALGMAPTDAMAIQDLVSRLRPGRIVVTNGPPGLCLFLDDLLRLLALPASRILAVGEALEPVPDQVVAVPGPARGAAALAAVERAVAAADMVLVLFAPDPGDHLPVDGLRAYAGFVTPRSYLVFLGTAFGQPWLGYSKQWRMTAIRRLLDWAPFSIDTGCNPHLVSTSPCGYLQRIEEPPHLAAQRLAEDDAVSGDEETGHGR